MDKILREMAVHKALTNHRVDIDQLLYGLGTHQLSAVEAFRRFEELVQYEGKHFTGDEKLAAENEHFRRIKEGGVA